MKATRRETLQGVALLAVAEKFGDGGYADVSLPGIPERKHPILPPGVHRRADFSRDCIGCGVCIAACPGHCLKPVVSLRDFGHPQLDFTGGYCRLACSKCGSVCPVGAIEKLHVEVRGNVHLGRAVFRSDLCLRSSGEEECTACQRKCPVQAIHLVKGIPVVEEEKCVGCGACEHVCPVRPMPAMQVEGFMEQRVVRPLSEADLVSEMISLVEGGESIVAAKGGVITARGEGRGIGPVLKLHDEGRLSGAIVVDKVVGCAAAAICIDGGVKRVEAKLMSTGAKRMLEARGIAANGAVMTEEILNHEKTDACPMEKAVKDLTDPAKMVEEIRKAMKKL